MADNSGNWPQWIKDAANWLNNSIIQPVASFVKDITEDINNFMTDVEKLKETYGNEHLGINTVLDRSAKALSKNKKDYFDVYGADYKALLEQELYANTLKLNKDELVDYNDLLNYGEAVENYDTALLSGDINKIKETMTAFKEAEKAKEDLLAVEGNEDFAIFFDEYKIDKSIEKLEHFKNIISNDDDFSGNIFEEHADKIKFYADTIKSLDLIYLVH